MAGEARVGRVDAPTLGGGAAELRNGFGGGAAEAGDDTSLGGGASD